MYFNIVTKMGNCLFGLLVFLFSAAFRYRLIKNIMTPFIPHDIVCVCVCVCVCVSEREREGESVCACVCVCVC